MTVLVFGAGSTAGKILSQIDGVVAVSNQMADARRPADCANLVLEVQPVAVIHLMADIDPRVAEQQEALVHCITAATPSAIAQSCRQLLIPMIHVSSTSVFDGTLGMPYIPSDPTNPLNALGRAHLSGEQGIAASGACYGVLRVPMTFNPATLFSNGRLVRVKSNGVAIAPDDVIAAPVPDRDLAAACITMAAGLANHPERTGTYHLCAQDECAMPDFLRESAKIAGRPLTIETAPQREVFGCEVWPKNTRMDCRTTKAVFGLDRPSWRSSMQEHYQPEHLQYQEMLA